MLASIRLLIGNHADLQIITRVHEMLDDRNFPMPYRLLLAQALMLGCAVIVGDELYDACGSGAGASMAIPPCCRISLAV